MSVDDTLMCSFSILRATDPARSGLAAATTSSATGNGLRPKSPARILLSTKAKRSQLFEFSC